MPLTPEEAISKGREDDMARDLLATIRLSEKIDNWMRASYRDNPPLTFDCESIRDSVFAAIKSLYESRGWLVHQDAAPLRMVRLVFRPARKS